MTVGNGGVATAPAPAAVTRAPIATASPNIILRIRSPSPVETDAAIVLRGRTRDAGHGSGASKAGATGLEPATSGVTGRRSNQLNYAPRRRRSVAISLCRSGRAGGAG